MGKTGISKLNVKTEVFNLEFTADVDDRNRVTIPKPIADVTAIKQGYKVTLILTVVYKTGED